MTSKSVAGSSKKNKNTEATQKPSNRGKRDYKKSKNQIQFVAIPKQDLTWAKKQKPSVMRLWMECWECDPYGSRWMTLNSDLSESAFRKAKKLISNKGLFIFKPDRSIRDGRETVSWLVKNLHGSRMKNFGIDIGSNSNNLQNQNSNKLQNKVLQPQNNSNKLQPDLNKSENDLNKSENDLNKSENDLNKPSISSQTQSEQEFSRVSITPHQHLNNSSKELLEVVIDDNLGGKDDREPAYGGRFTSVLPEGQSSQRLKTETENQIEFKNSSQNPDEEKISPPLMKKSTADADSTSDVLLTKNSIVQEPESEKEILIMGGQESEVLSDGQNLAINNGQNSFMSNTSSESLLAKGWAKIDPTGEKRKSLARKEKLRKLNPTHYYPDV